MTRRTAPRQPRRPGFTMIELLVVIAIIGILVALLLPAIIGAVRKANEAKVSADIQTIAVALQSFRNTYGEFPPSRVMLSESGVYSAATSQGIQANPAMIAPVASDYGVALSSITWYGTIQPTFGANDISFGTLAERSLRAIRKYFNRANPPTTALFHDFNGDNVMCTSLIYLEGDECLTFFLGGIPNPNGGGSFGMTGFGRNPLLPFTNSAFTTNRTQPIFEFQAARLIDDDLDGIPSYYDPTGTGSDGRAYAYFSAYNGQGYDPNDCNFDPSYTCPFQVGTPVLGPSNTTTSASPNPYTSSFPIQIAGGALNPGQPTSYLNTNSYQIIASGGDRVFGPGGQYLGGNTLEKLPAPPPPFTITLDDRFYEHDNLTNFAQGRLE